MDCPVPPPRTLGWNGDEDHKDQPRHGVSGQEFI
jgi:hypothetical protein